ncbi:MAG TPA: anion transporter [Stellaceae bacterium]|jgi:Na+/H+ antiporter NhaD/arsenite permease-like protein
MAAPDPGGRSRAPRQRRALSRIAGVAAIAIVAVAAVLAADRWPSMLAAIAANPVPAAAALIFAATYLVIAIGKLPGFYLDRAGAALLGASLMVAIGVLSLGQALRAIDFDTIALLLGMMIVVGNLRLSGFFRLAANWAASRARHPLLLLAAVILTSGLFSAFLVNDTICLALTPLVLDLVLRLRRDPVPYLLALAMASNIGSVATITGNPQNIMIGSFSHIPYGSFAAALSPVAAIGLLITFALIALLHPAEFRTRERLHGTPAPAHAYRPLAAKTGLVALAMMAGFFAGLEPAKLALVAGAVLLVTRAVRSDKIYREIDWPLLLMFAGLFIVVSGAEKSLLSPRIVTAIGRQHLDRTPVLALVTATLSNLVSNVPAVLVLKPFIAALPDPRRAWLVAAMTATLAGNLTILGSVANLIVVQRAARRGVAIGFWQYFRVGAPLTVLTILAGLWWL